LQEEKENKNPAAKIATLKNFKHFLMIDFDVRFLFHDVKMKRQK